MNLNTKLNKLLRHDINKFKSWNFNQNKNLLQESAVLTIDSATLNESDVMLKLEHLQDVELQHNKTWLSVKPVFVGINCVLTISTRMGVK